MSEALERDPGSCLCGHGELDHLGTACDYRACGCNVYRPDPRWPE